MDGGWLEGGSLDGCWLEGGSVDGGPDADCVGCSAATGAETATAAVTGGELPSPIGGSGVGGLDVVGEGSGVVGPGSGAAGLGSGAGLGLFVPVGFGFGCGFGFGVPDAVDASSWAGGLTTGTERDAS